MLTRYCTYSLAAAQEKGGPAAGQVSWHQPHTDIWVPLDSPWMAPVTCVKAMWCHVHEDPYTLQPLPPRGSVSVLGLSQGVLALRSLCSPSSCSSPPAGAWLQKPKEPLTMAVNMLELLLRSRAWWQPLCSSSVTTHADTTEMTSFYFCFLVSQCLSVCKSWMFHNHIN